MEMQLTEIARVVGAKNIDSSWNNIYVSSVDFDTRTLKPGALFVPLKDKRDGHDFLYKAKEKGAVASFWKQDHGSCSVDIPILIVDDPLKSLQKLAQYYLLMSVNPKVVAITGSNGKTTTKDMIAAILSTQFNIQKTKDNFNNEIGVPMTILSMKTNTEILILEMGMDNFGQLKFLSNLVKPDVVVITMIGEAHIGFFGSRDKIADAKMEITSGLKDDGLLVFNGDEQLLLDRIKKLSFDKRKFGKNHDNDIYPLNIESLNDRTQFNTNKWPDKYFSIPMMGSYNVYNSLASILVGEYFHVSVDKMINSLSNFHVTKNRTQWIVGKYGEKIISDVYNSNPSALIAVLNSFQKIPVYNNGKRIVVIGDMLELGDLSKKLHIKIAKFLNPNIINDVYLYGNEVKSLFYHLKSKYNTKFLHYYCLGDQEKLLNDLVNNINKNDIILIKGSHGMHLENLIKRI